MEKLTNVLKSIGFAGGDVDPCLLFKKTKNGLVLIGLYVDDLLIIRSDKDIDIVIGDIEKHFKVKIEGDLRDYLSCEICDKPYRYPKSAPRMGVSTMWA